jgi:hypothetical protein
MKKNFNIPYGNIVNTPIETCEECLRLNKHIDSPDVLESKLAESCYVIHLKKAHLLSSFDVLKITGVWVELSG